MGLKESGLRGSLRNTGSVTPAFFDVTITNTNSPVQEGDILTVDYGADNTGDAQDVQDIRLEIDSVQEDVDPGVMLAGGASTTGTLEWDTTGELEAEYTATVLSDDDSDSVIVEIGSAIPDSAVDEQDRFAHYDATFSFSGSEGEISNWPDELNNRDLTGSSPEVVSDGFNGLTAVDFNGSDLLEHLLDEKLEQPFTVFILADNNQPSPDDFHELGLTTNRSNGDVRILEGSDPDTVHMRAPDRVDAGKTATIEPSVYTFVFNGGNSEARLDGESNSGDAGQEGLPGISIGGSDGNASFIGQMVEIVIADTAVSASVIDEEESRLASKGGVTLS